MVGLTRRNIWLGGLAVATVARAAEPLRIAAASDLQVVLPLIAAAFERQSGIASRITFGSTGNFARQIRQGAPFDVFLAADQQFILDLARDGIISAVGPIYARGRLAVVVRAGTDFAKSIAAPPDAIASIAAAHDRGVNFRMAIANPEHAPYGQRAIEVLTNRGVLDKLRPRLVFGENVAQAAQYVATEAAGFGIVGLSLQRAPGLNGVLDFITIPPDWHAPLDQSLAILPKAGPTARLFEAYLLDTTARQLLAAHGFDLPARG